MSILLLSEHVFGNTHAKNDSMPEKYNWHYMENIAYAIVK